MVNFITYVIGITIGSLLTLAIIHHNKPKVEYMNDFTCTIVTKRFSQDKCAQFTSNDWIKENQ